MIKPLCKCHNEPMLHNGGGNFTCRVRKTERERRYRMTEAGRARVRRYRLREAVGRRAARINDYKGVNNR